MTSPAQRYVQAKDRSRRQARYPQLTDFTHLLAFELDDFQLRACEAVEDGAGVLVAAPTGAGKTVVGEFAVHLALASGRKCFYTTPIKALSNQKFADLVDRYGAANVGLLTGDNVVNGDAPVVVMTTEVLRNMLYVSSSTLDGLGYVVMDEVHYLADRFRGAVWEEVIIHLPQSVALVSLSATVSNTEEFADWLVTVRGKTEVVVDEHRPVPLWQHMLVGKRMFDMFASREQAKAREVDPELVRHTRDLLRGLPDFAPGRGRGRGQGRRGGGGTSARQLVPSRPKVIEQLDREGLLPAITFIFSRAGCDAAVVQCQRAGLRLTSPEERAEIRRIASERTRQLSAEDLHVLGYWEWLEGLQRGLAAHHAGMLPIFKEIVEELFVQGLVKAVFATETLALGINMPARTVVLERLVKFNGEAHVDITAGEYTQLTGRAGRRGIDVEGHAVVVWAPGTDPRHVAGLASTRTFPLRSSFRPSYNMAVNLVGSVGRERARELLESSFAQFQADRSVVGLVRQIQQNTDVLAGYAGSVDCELGDFTEYFAIRAKINEREKALSKANGARRREAVVEALKTLRTGDVVRVAAGRRSGLAVILEPGTGGLDDPRPLVLTEDRWAGRLSSADFSGEVAPLGRVKVPKNFEHRSPRARRDLASSLRAATVDDDRRRRRSRAAPGDDKELGRLRAALRAHPCHGCDDREQHSRWAERHRNLARETEALRQRVNNRTGSLARTFDRVCALLEARGYLAPAVVTDEMSDALELDSAAAAKPVPDEVTAAGRRLARLWSESDLLVSECLRLGAWNELGPAELAAAVSSLVYESRRPGESPASVPRGPLQDAMADTVRLAAELQLDESAYGLSLTREPDTGFVWPIYRWANGEPLDTVLRSSTVGGGADGELAAGDFVRWVRQVIDLLDQVAAAADPGTGLRSVARAAVESVRRGVVAWSTLAEEAA